MSLGSRISQAAHALFSRSAGDANQYGILPPSLSAIFNRSFGLPPPFKPEEAQDAYSDNPYLYAAVNLIAHEIARTKFRTVKEDKQGRKVSVSHISTDTLARPQPMASGKSMMTGYILKFLLGQHLMLNGEAFWLLDGRMKVNGAPTFITPLNPAFVYETLNPDGTILEYRYRLPGGPTTAGWVLDPADVVHFRLPDPKNWYRGHSPIQPIRYALDTYKEADTLNVNRLKNNAVPSGVLETDGNPPESEREKLKNQWNQRYGGTENSGRVAVLPNKYKFNAIQQSNSDMQYIEGKNITRDEILANLGVPIDMLGHTESKTRANADTSAYIFAKHAILPKLEFIADTLTNDFLTVFPGSDGIEYIFDNPVPEDDEAKRANISTLFASGAMTPDEAREEFDFDPMNKPGTKTTYIPFQMTPVDSTASPPLTTGKNKTTNAA